MANLCGGAIWVESKKAGKHFIMYRVRLSVAVGLSGEVAL
jgi:hypothetical protein